VPRYLIRRVLGNVSDAEPEAAADVSRRVHVDQFPDIEWEHSHVVRTSEGLTSYCVHAAPNAERVRDHAASPACPPTRCMRSHTSFCLDVRGERGACMPRRRLPDPPRPVDLRDLGGYMAVGKGNRSNSGTSGTGGV
jgi:hypothetical protein